MAGFDFWAKVGDRLPAIEVTLEPSSIDLTGCTVTFAMATAAGATPKIQAPARVVQTTEPAIVAYDWADGDLDTAAEYVAEFVVTYADGREQSFPSGGYLAIKIIGSVQDDAFTPDPDEPGPTAFISPGSNKTVEVQAQIDAGVKRIKFAYPGEYVFESGLEVLGGTNDLVMEFVEGAYVTPPQYTAADADHGDVSYWLRATPVYGAFDGTLSATLKAGLRTFTVVSATGLVAGVWVEIDTHRAATFDASTDVFTCPGHNYVSNDMLRAWPGNPRTYDVTPAELPSGMAYDVDYYVRDVSGDTFKVSATPGPGAAANFTTNGSGILIRKASANEDMYGRTDAASIRRRFWAKVVSVVGTTVTIDRAAPVWMAKGARVRSGEPVERLTVRGIDFRNTGGEVASAVRLEGVQVADIEGVFAGLSRAAVDAEDSANMRLDLHSAGQLNALWLGHSCHDVDVFGRQRGSGDRTHPSGYVRGLISFYHRCANVRVSADTFLAGGACGVHANGSVASTIRGTYADMDVSYRVGRDPGVLETGGTLYCAAPGVNVSIFNVSARGEYTDNIDVDVTVLDPRQPYNFSPATYWAAAVVMSDCTGSRLSGAVINHGESSQAASRKCVGFAFYDTFGLACDELVVVGAAPALIFYNFNNVSIDRILASANDGEGGVGGSLSYGVLFYYPISTGLGTHVRIRDMTVSNYVYPFAWIGGTGMLEDAFMVDAFNLTSVERALAVGMNATGATVSAAEVVEHSATTRASFVNPTTSDARLQRIVSGYGAGNGAPFIGSRNGVRLVLVRAADAVAVRDLLVADPATARRAKVDNAAANPLGFALTTKSAGSEGYVYISGGPA